MAVLHESETQQPWRVTPDEQRVFTRVPFAHTVRWLSDKGDGGTATVRDVSRSGLCLSLTRFLRPGPEMRIYFDGIEYQGTPIALDAAIVWSRPENGARDRFVTGFRIIQNDPVTLAAISEVFYAAILQYAETHQLR